LKEVKRNLKKLAPWNCFLKKGARIK